MPLKIKGKTTLRWLLLLAFGAGLGRYIYTHPQDFSVVHQVSAQLLLFVSLLHAVLLVMNAAQSYVVARHFGYRSGFLPWLRLAVYSRTFNSFVPQAGNAYRIAALKMTHNFSITDYVASFSVFSVLNRFLTLLFVLGTVLVFERDLSLGGLSAASMLFGIISAIVLVFIAVVLFHGRVQATLEALLARVLPRPGVVGDMLETLRDKNIVLQLLLWGLVSFALSLIAQEMCFSALGSSVSWAVLAVLKFFKSTTDSISLTPGNAGVTESMYGLLVKGMGATASVGIIVGGILTLVSLLSVLMLVPVVALLTYLFDSNKESLKLKDNIPPGLISPLKRIQSRVKMFLLRGISRSGFLCALYYALFSPAFRREQKSVVNGLLKYFDESGLRSQAYLLRRNTHRLEKGLLMRPRKELFALDYIGDTVQCLSRCVSHAESRHVVTETRWAYDVLSEYFSVIGNHSLVEKARTIFEQIKPQCEAALAIDISREPKKIPYKRDLQQQVVGYDVFLELARRRRSVRWFLNKPVPQFSIDQALLVATQAPSSCNRQPFQYRFFDDQEVVRQIANIPLGTAGFANNIPMICALVGDLSAFFGERDRHVMYIDGALSAMSFMFALETLGLSSCPLNWPDIERLERKMARALGLSAHERVIMLIGIGYPDPEAMVAYSEKRSLDELRQFNVGPLVFQQAGTATAPENYPDGSKKKVVNS